MFKKQNGFNFYNGLFYKDFLEKQHIDKWLLEKGFNELFFAVVVLILRSFIFSIIW